MSVLTKRQREAFDNNFENLVRRELLKRLHHDLASLEALLKREVISPETAAVMNAITTLRYMLNRP